MGPLWVQTLFALQFSFEPFGDPRNAPLWVQIIIHIAVLVWTFWGHSPRPPSGSKHYSHVSFRLNLLGALAMALFGFRSFPTSQFSLEPSGGSYMGPLWVQIIIRIAVFVWTFWGPSPGPPLGSDHFLHCRFRLNLLGALAWAPLELSIYYRVQNLGVSSKSELRHTRVQKFGVSRNSKLRCKP